MADTVLVVDDDANIRAVLALYLETAGLRIIEAATIEQARDQFQDPDIVGILMDGELENGVTTTGLVKEILESGFQRPIVAMSSNEDKNQELLAAGCTGVLPKAARAAVALHLIKKHFQQ